MPCAQLLTEWYPPSERGSWWGMVSTSSTIGSSIAQVGFPIICTMFFEEEWRSTMMTISIFPIIVSVITYFLLAPSPKSVGLEGFEEDKKSKNEKKDSTPIGRVKEVLSNPGVHLLSLSSLCIYTLRMGVTNWIAVYCKQQRGFSTVAAGGITFWMEVGGVFGSTFSGYLSDKYFDRRRAPVNVIFSLAAGLCIFLFQFTSNAPIMSTIMFLFGFFFYGPQTVSRLKSLNYIHLHCFLVFRNACY